MITLQISNSYCLLKNASLMETLIISDLLSVPVPGFQFNPSYKKGFWDGTTSFLDKGKFPKGLLNIVVAELRSKRIRFQIEDTRKAHKCDFPDEIVLKDGVKNITLRDYQLDSVLKALQSTNGIVNVATNGGKTEIACGIIKCVLPYLQEDERICFFTHSKEIAVQSRERIHKRLNIPVGLIGMDYWDEEQVNVVLIPTISKYLTVPKKLPKLKKLTTLKERIEDLKAEYAITKSKEVKEKLKAIKQELAEQEQMKWNAIRESVDRANALLSSTIMFIGDEVHHASSDTWYSLFLHMDNAYYRFGLTGTVEGEHLINDWKLKGSTGEVVSRVSNRFLIENGYSARPTIFMLDLGDIDDVDELFYPDIIKEGIIYNDTRNTIFVNKVLERAKNGKRCLIIVNEIEHGEIVEQMLENQGITYRFSHGDKSSKYRQECLDLLKEGELQILIATSILDEGVDVSNINCVFLMVGRKSSRQLLQRIGRGLRKKEDDNVLEVYDALDYHNDYLIKHLKDRLKIYKQEGFKVVKVNLPQ